MIYYVTYRNAMGFIFKARMNTMELCQLKCNKNFEIISVG